jgi:hypothetical protein
VVSGGANSRTPSVASTAAASVATAFRVVSARARYPASPMCRSVASAAAIGPPDRVDEITGLIIV